MTMFCCVVRLSGGDGGATVGRNATEPFSTCREFCTPRGQKTAVELTLLD